MTEDKKEGEEIKDAPTLEEMAKIIEKKLGIKVIPLGRTSFAVNKDDNIGGFLTQGGGWNDHLGEILGQGIPPDIKDRLQQMAKKLSQEVELPPHIKTELNDLAQEAAYDIIKKCVTDIPSGKKDDFDAFMQMIMEGKKDYHKNIEKHSNIGTALIQAIYDNYENGDKIDMMDTFATMCRAFLSIIQAQTHGIKHLKNSTKEIKPLTQSEVEEISILLTNKMGAEMAKRGLAHSVLDELRAKKEMK